MPFIVAHSRLPSPLSPASSLFWLCLSILLFAGCVTPYQPLGYTGGYSDLVLDDETFRVSFIGNGYTSSDIVETYLLYRCAELTVQRGFDYFVIMDSKNGTDLYIDSDRSEVSSFNTHRAAHIIKVFKGPKPTVAGTFGAREIMENLQAQLAGLAKKTIKQR